MKKEIRLLGRVNGLKKEQFKKKIKTSFKWGFSFIGYLYKKIIYE